MSVIQKCQWSRSVSDLEVPNSLLLACIHHVFKDLKINSISYLTFAGIHSLPTSSSILYGFKSLPVTPGFSLLLPFDSQSPLYDLCAVSFPHHPVAIYSSHQEGPWPWRPCFKCHILIMARVRNEPPWGLGSTAFAARIAYSSTWAFLQFHVDTGIANFYWNFECMRVAVNLL